MAKLYYLSTLWLTVINITEIFYVLYKVLRAMKQIEELVCMQFNQSPNGIKCKIKRALCDSKAAYILRSFTTHTLTHMYIICTYPDSEIIQKLHKAGNNPTPTCPPLPTSLNLQYNFHSRFQLREKGGLLKAAADTNPFSPRAFPISSAAKDKKNQ